MFPYPSGEVEHRPTLPQFPLLKMRMVSNTFDPFTFYLLLPGAGVGKDTEACPEALLLRDLNLRPPWEAVGNGASSQRTQKQQATAFSWEKVPQ